VLSREYCTVPKMCVWVSLQSYVQVSVLEQVFAVWGFVTTHERVPWHDILKVCSEDNTYICNIFHIEIHTYIFENTYNLEFIKLHISNNTHVT